MKENYFYKMKRLLLFAVFMTLPALWQYAGAQVTLQAVDAGFTDGKWWIDLKNPGSTDLSGNGGENDKLGICFYIENLNSIFFCSIQNFCPAFCKIFVCDYNISVFYITRQFNIQV